MPKGSIKAPGSSAAMASRVFKRASNTAKLQGKRIDEATRKLNEGAAARKQARVSARDVRAEPGSRVKKMNAPVGKGGR